MALARYYSAILHDPIYPDTIPEAGVIWDGGYYSQTGGVYVFYKISIEGDCRRSVQIK